MEDKVLTFVARAAAAIITGGGCSVYQRCVDRPADARFVRAGHDVSILNQHLISDDLYRDWGRSSSVPRQPRWGAGVVYLRWRSARSHSLQTRGERRPADSVADPTPLGGRCGTALYIRHYHRSGILVWRSPCCCFRRVARPLATRFIVFAVPVIAYSSTT
jgi:hypothetical protein